MFKAPRVMQHVHSTQNRGLECLQNIRRFQCGSGHDLYSPESSGGSDGQLSAIPSWCEDTAEALNRALQEPSTWRIWIPDQTSTMQIGANENASITGLPPKDTIH